VAQQVGLVDFALVLPGRCDDMNGVVSLAHVPTIEQIRLTDNYILVTTNLRKGKPVRCLATCLAPYGSKELQSSL
jgi:hypothetical protein